MVYKVFKLAAVIAIGTLLFYLSSCQFSLKTSKGNQVTFDSIMVDKSYHLLDDIENPNCNLQINFVYPVSADNGILPTLQKEFVSAYFGEAYDTLSPSQAVKKYTDDYIAAYKDLEEDFKESRKNNEVSEMQSWFSYYESSSSEIVFNQDDILSFTVNFENYTGGAHGSHSYNHYVIYLNTGQRLTEEDIFVDDYQSKLAKILIYQLTKQYNLTDPKELENVGIFSVDEIYPNNNFYVDKTGITYTYNEYEIAAYVVGPIYVHLSYEQIEMLLKRDSPITRIIHS